MVTGLYMTTTLYPVHTWIYSPECFEHVIHWSNYSDRNGKGTDMDVLSVFLVVFSSCNFPTQAEGCVKIDSMQDSLAN